MSNAVIGALRDVVGADHVLTDPDAAATYGHDWTGRWSSTPLAVVRPQTTAEVSEVVRVCADAGVPVVAQGGNTGLVGGSVPSVAGAVVLSTRRVATAGPVDEARRQVTVGAGTTIADLQSLAARHSLMYGVDLAARDSATIGGTVATNAGGVRVVCFGDTRRNVTGIEAVTADGSVLSHLDGLPKDSAGFDVTRLLVGSEGTLAVITAVRVQLQAPLPADRLTTLVGVPTLEHALQVVEAAAPSEEVLAVEYMDDTGMRLVRELAELPHPVADRWPYYLLLETVREPILSADADAAVDRRLWVYRERQPEAAASLGMIHSLDIALPRPALDEFVTLLPALVAPHRVFTFGHLAEGNLHIQVAGPAADDESVTDRVLHAVVERGGSISSEHGIGRAKTAYLPLSRGEAELRSMRNIKDALDPHGLLNPGVLFAR